MGRCGQDKRHTFQRVSGRAEAVSPFLAMEVLERAGELERAGQEIIHLEIGEPDFPTPQIVLEAGIQALKEGHTHYTHSLGHPELREAISDWFGRQYGVEVDSERIIVTVGSSGAMLLVLGALLDPGMKVLMTDPHYACYPKFVSVFDGIPVPLAVSEEEDFQLSPQVVKEKLDSNARVLILNSPANPTGTVISAERMQELVEVAAGRVVIVSDEVYHGLVYEGKANTMLEFCEDAVVIGSFSKLFAMTGWRLGYAVVPEFLMRSVQKLQQNLFISAPDFAQFAAVVALKKTGEEIEWRRERYDERRRLVLQRLEEMGLKVKAEPRGAFYVFVNIAQYAASSLDFAFQLLEEAKVAITPGIDFGVHGEGFIRISYANSMANIEKGMKRLRAFLETTSQG